MTADVLPDAATAFGQRVRARLQKDTVIWIVTVGADGRPQPNPVGFCRDGDADSTEFVIYSRPDSHRLKHLRERPDKVSFHFDSDGHGQDIVVLHGRVVVDDDHPVIQDWPPYLEKYGPCRGTGLRQHREVQRELPDRPARHHHRRARLLRAGLGSVSQS